MLNNRWQKSLENLFRIAMILTLIVLVACERWRIWSLHDYLIFQEVQGYAIGEDLWFGRIRPGTSVDDLIAKSPPHESQQYGPYLEITYGTIAAGESLWFAGVTLIAKDGKLIEAEAHSCTWQRTFFEMRDHDRIAFDRLFHQHVDELVRQSNEKARQGLD